MIMKLYRAEPFNTERLMLGEGMLWDDKSNHALWVDITNGCILESDERGSLLWKRKIPDQATSVALAKDGALIVTGERSVYRVERDGSGFQKIAALSGIPSNQRLNDGKCDSEGRFMVGTMVTDGSEPTGKLFSIAVDGSTNVLLSGLGCSNGIGFSPCGKYVYHIDTPTKKVRRYNYNPETGAISSPEVAVDTARFEGVPEGMTVDRDGCLYVGMWGGGGVLCFDPDHGKLLARVDLPCKLVTSCAFGGTALDKLLITTASQGDENPCAGQTYCVNTEAKGAKTFCFG
jgi:sugar lactone lactonase YvrE